MLTGLNEYGALLDIHQDKIKSEITNLHEELCKINGQIKQLEASKETIQDTIQGKNHERDLYLKMREMIGHVK